MKPKAIKGVEILKAYHPPLSGRDGFLRLDFNEWLGDPHPALQKVISGFSLDKLNMYPEAERAIAAVGQQFGVPAENVLLSNGVDEAFCNVFRTYLDRGDQILLPDPGYAMMEFYATLCEAQLVTWELNAPDFSYSTAQAEDFLKKGGKCVAVGQPNNPTGSFIDLETIKSWCRKWPDRLFVVDEAYIEFGGCESLAPDVVNFPNLIVFRTFSKAWSLAGLRLGSLMSSIEIVTELKKMWSPYSVNVLGLSILSEMLPDPEWVEKVQGIVQAERSRLKKEMAARNLKAHFGGGNFFLLYIGEGLVDFIKGFEESGIRLRDHNSKRGLQGWVRVSIGPQEITDRFLATLDDVIKKVKEA